MSAFVKRLTQVHTRIRPSCPPPAGTTVIELMWQGNYLNTPTAFYAHSVALRQDYWMVQSRG